MPNDRLDHERALGRDAVQFAKDFSLFVLRTCVLLHGGAIIALLGLLSAIISHPHAGIISVTALRVAIMIFAIGLLLTVAAGICGYVNFLAAESLADLPQEIMAKRFYTIYTSRTWATKLTIVSLVFFGVGVATVAVPW
jgi:hypothetical protein